MYSFLGKRDSNRALMGANMQRQAVPLIDPKAPFVGTGMEYQAAHDSGAAVIAQHGGKVTYADADKVEVRREDGSLDVYHIKIPSFKLRYCLQPTYPCSSWRCHRKR